ncbi:MAG: hypothetical protein NDJ92_01395 [Thermoanaerobaculia bacterium]|nr:hypothetical protein [Thermoanaerobaculia bacterium]
MQTLKGPSFLLVPTDVPCSTTLTTLDFIILLGTVTAKIAVAPAAIVFGGRATELVVSGAYWVQYPGQNIWSDVHGVPSGFLVESVFRQAPGSVIVKVPEKTAWLELTFLTVALKFETEVDPHVNFASTSWALDRATGTACLATGFCICAAGCVCGSAADRATGTSIITTAQTTRIATTGRKARILFIEISFAASALRSPNGRPGMPD